MVRDREQTAAIPVDGSAVPGLLAKVGTDSHFPPLLWDDAVWIGGRLTELLPLLVGLKQALLEMNAATPRLDS